MSRGQKIAKELKAAAKEGYGQFKQAEAQLKSENDKTDMTAAYTALRNSGKSKRG